MMHFRPLRTVLRVLGLAGGGACLLESVACTTLLGIDGHYVALADGTGGEGGAGSPPTEDAAQLEPGRDASTHARALDGQAILDARGGDALEPPRERDAEAVDGCFDCPPPVLTACTPGSYEGPLSGTHASSFTVVGVPFELSGVVRFRLGEPVGGVATIEDGAVVGTAVLPTPVPFTGTLAGTVACDTGLFSTKLDGSYSLISGVTVDADGSYDGTFSSSAFSGTWAEAEPYADQNGKHPYGGSGKWGPVGWKRR